MNEELIIQHRWMAVVWPFGATLLYLIKEIS